MGAHVGSTTSHLPLCGEARRNRRDDDAERGSQRNDRGVLDAGLHGMPAWMLKEFLEKTGL